VSQSIAVRRDGARVVIEAREATKDHVGLLTETLLDVDAARWLVETLQRLVAEIEEAK